MRVWVQLYRLRTDSYLDTHIEVPIDADVKEELEDIIMTDWPGWQMVQYATPAFQGEDGTPLDF